LLGGKSLRLYHFAVLGMAAALVFPLGGCSGGGLIKPGASMEQVQQDRETCRRESALNLRPPRPEAAPTFNASSAPLPMGSAHDVGGAGDAQMADVMDRTGVDTKTFERCLRAHGFRKP